MYKSDKLSRYKISNFRDLNCQTEGSYVINFWYSDGIWRFMGNNRKKREGSHIPQKHQN